jgi:protein-S-isoprenylcysteine O-methyltransferase Ste14
MGLFLPIQRDPWAEAAAVVVFLSWLGYVAILLWGKSRGEQEHQVREVKSHLGFAMQLLAYAGSCIFSRQLFTPIVPLRPPVEAALSVFTIVLAIASMIFCFAAARVLERQWALVARVIEGHELIQRGPYAVVRNPIYLAMFGTWVATALAFTRWEAAVPLMIVFIVGTAIRIRSEEKLLREAFGVQFEAYARRIPAFFPGIY